MLFEEGGGARYCDAKLGVSVAAVRLLNLVDRDLAELGHFLSAKQENGVQVIVVIPIHIF